EQFLYSDGASHAIFFAEEILEHAQPVRGGSVPTELHLRAAVGSPRAPRHRGDCWQRRGRVGPGARVVPMPHRLPMNAAIRRDLAIPLPEVKAPHPYLIP